MASISLMVIGCVRTRDGLGRLVGGGLAAVLFFVALVCCSARCFLSSLSSKAAIRSALNFGRRRFGFCLGRGKLRNALGGSAMAIFLGGAGFFWALGFGFSAGFGFGVTTSAGFAFGAGLGGAGASTLAGSGGGGGGGGALATAGSGFGSGAAMGFSFGAGGGGFFGCGSTGFWLTVRSAMVTSSTMIGCSTTTGGFSRSGRP